jgi:predicted RecA/RadA family phage recombinase
VFNVTKTTGATQAFTVGKKIYSTATGAATVTASGGTPLGHATAAAATGAATADVKLGTF